jgi:predicted Zn-ribbon and HTH transcriptional regulator
MSVAEMKVKAMNHLVQLEDENSVKEILEHLEKIADAKSRERKEVIENIFQEAKEKYGNTLKKLAE